MSLKTSIKDEMDKWLRDEDYCTYIMSKYIPDILKSIDKSTCILWLQLFSDNLKGFLHNEKSLLYFIYKKERGLPVKESFPFATIEEAEKELEQTQLKIQRAIYMRQKLRELGVEVEETIDIDEEDILENVTGNSAVRGQHDVEQGEEKGLEEEDIESTGETEYPQYEDDEKDEEETNPLIQKILNIIEKGKTETDPYKLMKIGEELKECWDEIDKGTHLDKDEAIMLRNKFDKIMEVPENCKILGVGYLNTRRRDYMRMMGEENKTETDKAVIEQIKKEFSSLNEGFMKELTGKTIPPLRTEEEYVEELKNIELEMIKAERNMETKRHFIFGKKGKNQEDESKEDITEKMMQMYLELSEVADVTKTNKIQHIYNRIIRSLKRMPDIDDSKIPPTLKEMVVQRVETPLPNVGNGDGNIESRKIPRTGENIGEDGPLME